MLLLFSGDFDFVFGLAFLFLFCYVSVSCLICIGGCGFVWVVASFCFGVCFLLGAGCLVILVWFCSCDCDFY